MKAGRPRAALRSSAYRSSSAHLASRSGSFCGRLAFIGKAVCGKVRVAFNSGAADIVTPWDGTKWFNLQCKWLGNEFPGYKTRVSLVYCLWEARSISNMEVWTAIRRFRDKGGLCPA